MSQLYRVRYGVTFTAFVVSLAAATAASGQTSQTKGSFEDKFRQLDEILPTANDYRTASGAPGNAYWQQEVDYKIKATLDEQARRIIGSEEITYTNHSPDTLSYLWVQLDQNRFRNDSIARLTETGESYLMPETGSADNLSFSRLRREQLMEDFDAGFQIKAVTDNQGNELPVAINGTMMRIDLPQPLASGASVALNIDWEHNIIHETVLGGRGGYEYFEKTDTYQYALSQWFPRLAVYSDYAGWINKQFLGSGEFTLEFGDYDVSLTVPADHIVASTGVLQNPEDVLTAAQRERLQDARNADTPVFIVTPEEAEENQQAGTDDAVTWHFKAEDVRDFAWASSRKYIWDAMAHHQEDGSNPLVMAMSFYPPEAEPLWSRYSTHVVAHTMDVYSKFSFAYPYPTAISVNAWEAGGMEYPMITFNGYRPVLTEKEGEENSELTYSRTTKYGLISVIIHEIGHIYFPMTVNSDERQWTWMDEGLNTFLQFLAEREWEDDYPSTRGDPKNITEYMISSEQVPIMTQSDSILQFGNNAYAKPATALVILRETVMGRSLFDFAFREYARRWMFKRPTPADFFRTLEDASAVDLDWFWRGWFYSTDHVDVALDGVRAYRVSSQDPAVEFPLNREEAGEKPVSLTQRRNQEAGIETRLQRSPELEDFYNENDEFEVSNADRNAYADFREDLEDWEKFAMDQAVDDGTLIYFLDFDNVGGLVMPLPLRLHYEDGTVEDMLIPAEIWRRNSHSVSKMLVSHQPIVKVELDPELRIADTDMSNNTFPQEIRQSRIELYKLKDEQRNLMGDMLVELKAAETGEEVETPTEVPLEPVE